MDTDLSDECFGIQRGALNLEHFPKFAVSFSRHLNPKLIYSRFFILLSISLPKPFSFPTDFNPDAIIFDARHRQQVIVSDIGIALTLGALAAWGSYSSGGFGEVMRYYGVPYLWVNNWLVMITFLQHTDPLLPHYKAEAWTFPRGALCTVDRSWLGPVGPYLLHGIAE